jgi:uncharacterized YccA/Bax inhibitor family protein
MPRGNPAMSEAVYDRVEPVGLPTEAMTLQGSVVKTAILMVILLATAGWSWSQPARSPVTSTLLVGGLIGGLVVALITIFSPRSAPVTAPLYAALEGLVLGTISAFFEAAYPGVVINAIALSIGVLALMLFGYGSGIIPVTEKFKIAIVAATGAICLVYLVSIVFTLFGVRTLLIHQSGLVGIAFSAIVVIIAALNLVLDFDFIQQGVQRQAPRYMEWYAGFSLLVTLVWMYLEILRLLSKVRGGGRS